MDRKTPSPANIVIIAGGVVMLLGSFLKFWKFGSNGFNAWSTDWYAPVTLIPVICGVVLATVAAVDAFGLAKLPDNVVGFTWVQLSLVLAVQALIMMLAWLIVDNSSYSVGIGLILMLLAAVALVVGAVMRTQEPVTTT